MMTGVEYRAGGWWALVRPDSVLLLSATVDDTAARALWEVQAGGFPAVLDALSAASGGLRSMPSFAGVFPDDRVSRVVVRGEAFADVDGERVSADGVGTWIERAFITPRSVALLGGDQPDAAGVGLPLTAGIVRAATVEIVGQADAGDAKAFPSVGVAPITPEPAPRRHASSALSAPTQIEPEEEPLPDPTSEPHPAGRTTGIARHEEVTALAASLRAERAEPARSYGRIELSTGGSHPITRRILIGREPSVSRVSADDVPDLVSVPSPSSLVSGNHLEVRIEGSYVMARDLESRNGTILLRPDQPARRLNSGSEVSVMVDDAFELGDGVIVTFRDVP